MKSTPPPVPNFFLAGAPKTGTTSLYHYLNQHPQIYLSPVKEPCYFASEVRLNRFGAEFESAARRRDGQLRGYLAGPMLGPDPGGIVAEWKDYLTLFKNVRTETAVGEASVCYLWSPTAAANISARISDAKIIVILRDPAERAFSQYLQYAAAGLVRQSFREHIECSVRNTRREFSIFYPFLEYGLYYSQVKAYLDRFPSSRVQIYFYEDAWADPLGFLRALFGYLDVAQDFQVDVSERKLQRRAPRWLTGHYLLRKSGVAAHVADFVPRALKEGARSALFKRRESLRLEGPDRAYLRGYYRDDILRLASLLNRDLGAWLK